MYLIRRIYKTKPGEAAKVARLGKRQGEIYCGSEYEVNILRKVKLVVAVKNDLVESVVEAIICSAQTGKIGDGKIFIYSLEKIVRIRTVETGNAAI